MAKTILFVDEDQSVRKSLKRGLRDMRDEWEMRFAASPDEGLAMLNDESVEVLVTEVAFTSSSGIDFLFNVKTQYPQPVRIIMSGYVDRRVILKSVDLAHQYIAKPCDHSDLKHTITKAFLVKELLAQDSLKKVVASIDSLPSLPALYLELVEELKSEDASIQKVGDIISKDIGITAKLLKTVNSSFFGLPQRVTSPAKAVSLLGLDLVQSIVLMSGTFDKFKKLKFKGFSLEQMWDHALVTGVFARNIARAAGYENKGIETAFMAGLLHDIGKLLVAAYLPERFNSILQLMNKDDSPMADAEMTVLGTTHAPIGAYLLGLWGLPDPIIEATAYHHTPGHRLAETFSFPGLIHIANAFVNAGPSLSEDSQVIPFLDYAYIEDAKLMEHLSKWRSCCADQLES